VISTLTTDNQIQLNPLRAVIREYRESINQTYHDAQPMVEEEFPQFINYIRQRLFTNTLPIRQTENDNTREMLQEILQQSRNQTEFLRRITEMLSNLTEPRTIVKLSLAFVLLCTVNKFFKHQ
jgi:glutamyl-tRNA reductase